METATKTPTVDTETSKETEENILNAHDRCDHSECSARAWFRLPFKTGFLDFCLHHYKEVEAAALPSLKGKVIDESGQLYENKLKGSVNS